MISILEINLDTKYFVKSYVICYVLVGLNVHLPQKYFPMFNFVNPHSIKKCMLYYFNLKNCSYATIFKAPIC